MSASAYRDQKRPDRNVGRRVEIVDLAQGYGRDGVAMIYFPFWQEGEPVNDTQLQQLYRQVRFDGRRCQRKKVLLRDRSPLFCSSAANTVWSLDGVCDGTGDSCVDVPDHRRWRCGARHLSYVGVTRVLVRLELRQGRSKHRSLL